MGALSKAGLCSLAAAFVGCLATAASPRGGVGAPCARLDAADVVVATVRKVSQHAATNANPPRVELRVHEVLRGDPKADRSHAVWDGQPCDVDWAGQGADEAMQRWRNRPVAPPKVGSKMILWGQFRKDGGGVTFHVPSGGRAPWSDATRAWAIQSIQSDARKRQATAIQQAALRRLAAGAKAPPDAVAEWRARVSVEDIRQYARQADFVVVAALEGARTYRAAPVALRFRVLEVLKGQRRDVANILTSRKLPLLGERPCWLIVSVPSSLCELLDREARYVLFLSEEGLGFFWGEPVYPRVRPGDGLVIADDAAVAAVREAVRGEAPRAAPRRVMMIDVAGRVLFPGQGRYSDEEASADCRRKLIAQVRAAAHGHYTTFAMTGLPPGLAGPTEAGRDPPIAPNGNALVMVRFEKPGQPADAPVKLTWWAVRGGQGSMQIAFDGADALAGERWVFAQAAEIVRRLGLTQEGKRTGKPKR